MRRTANAFTPMLATERRDGGILRTATRHPPVGPGTLALTDARIALLLLEDVRRRMLERLTGFTGLSRNESRFLALIALGALAKALDDTNLPFGAPVAPSATDLMIGGSLMNEMARGIAGNPSRSVQGFSGLVAFALMWKYRPVVRGSFGIARASAHFERRLRTFYRDLAKRT